MKKRYFAYRSFLPELETMKKFRESGIDTFAYMVSNTCNSLGMPYTPYPPVWKWNGLYDLDAFARQTDDILQAVPDAKLICMLDLNTPHWWSRYLGAFGVRHDSYYGLGKITGAEVWKKDVTAYLETVLDYAEKHYSDHIVAYVLGGGGATEWHDRSHGEESIYRTVGFRKWLKANGKPEADIPPMRERYGASHDFDNSFTDIATYYNGIDPTGCLKELYPEGIGLMRTPAESQNVIDYWKYVNESNAEVVSQIFATAKKKIRKEVELGGFFGYSFATWTLFAGHLAYEKFFRSEYVDFIIAPIGREHRIGGNSSSATVLGTVQMAGKRMLQEMDQRTFTSNRKINEFCTLPDPLQNAVKYNEFKDATDSVELSKKFSMDPGGGIWINERDVCAGIKRDAAFCLIEDQSMWWFDMWGGFYQGKAVMDTFRQTKEIWQKYGEIKAENSADILIVADPENMYFLNDLNSRCGSFITAPSISASLSGMTYSTCSMNDLYKMDCSQYKLIILSHPFRLSGEKQRLIREKFQHSGKTVMYLYGPCIDESGNWDESQTEKLCGIPFGSKGIVSASHGEWTACYTAHPEELEAEIMREIALKAGCHPWLDKPRAVRANSGCLSIHTAWAETLTVTLPKKYSVIRELYTGFTITDTDTFELKTDGTETFLFSLEE